MADSSFLARAGQWFLNSGIQEPGGGVARYYRSDLGRNNAVSTEITGYALSTLVYLHTLTRLPAYLEHAVAGARFLAHTAWRRDLDTIPFETEPAAEGLLGYFFDCGIIVRGLLAVYRATGDGEFLAAATAVGRSMARDFCGADSEVHPVVRLPEKQPLPRDDRWSRAPGCYQLKSAMAWHDLCEATGSGEFAAPYQRVLDYALRTCGTFLPGHPDRHKVMDRLHPYCYFLEGLLPRAREARVANAIREGISKVAQWLRRIAPEFERSDVYAQLLRIRIYADWNGVAALDHAAAEEEAARLETFQLTDADPRIDGGFSFGRKAGALMPYVNPVSTGFALQALALWQQCRAGGGQAHRHLLI